MTNTILKGVASTLCGACFSLAYAQDRPNIVLFIVDDMGVMDTSLPFLTNEAGEPVTYPLNQWYQTPHMERMAEQGVRFSTFYAQSVSSPSRASMMTGQNAARHGTTNWINSESNNRTPFGPTAWNWDGLRSTDLIYPQVLKAAGYHTIHVGKAHFGHIGSEGEDPTRLGFDVNVAGSSIGQPGSYLPENGYGWTGGNHERAVPGLEKYHGTDVFLTDALTIEAGKEIEKAVNAGKPFYLNLSHYAVHHPFEADQRFLAHYQDSDKPEEAQAFATLIEGMDKSLGDLLDKLESLGVAENTLVLFLGDNGGDAPLGGPDEYGSSAPLRGKKGAEYEGGVRVPFIAAWAKPDATNPFQQRYPIAQNFIQQEMGTVMDIYPTVLAAAGLDCPQGHQLDGTDLKNRLSGSTDATLGGHRDDFLMHFPHEHRGSYFTMYRKGDWKLIYYYNPATPDQPDYKLYNLAKDEFETTDLAVEYNEKAHELFQLMVARLELEGALYPEDAAGNSLNPVFHPKK